MPRKRVFGPGRRLRIEICAYHPERRYYSPTKYGSGLFAECPSPASERALRHEIQEVLKHGKWRGLGADTPDSSDRDPLAEA